MTVDNEQGRATGWLPGELSEQGRIQARQLGRRRTGDHITAVFSSDLVRAAQTALVAFGRSANPVLHDWRLRQCDYGQRNGMPAAELHASRREYLPGRGKLAAGHNPASAASSAICHCWDGQRVLVIGHVATRWGLDHFLGGIRWKTS